MNQEKSQKIKWYDDAGFLSLLMIGCILIIVFFSQSFLGGKDLSFHFIGSVINHNSTYLVVLVYFLFIQFSFGKRYFNYFNVLLTFLYFITTITSFLTILQSFSLATVLTFTLHFVLLIYLFHTMFRGTRVWKEYHLSESPFNELTNEWLFYTVCVLSLFLLAVRFISTTALSGVFLSTLDSIYFVLLGRYIFLYREFLDRKKLDSNNKGNFDELREKIKDTVEDCSEKIQNVLDQTDIDEKVIELKDKVVEAIVPDGNKDSNDDSSKDTIKKDNTEIKEKKKSISRKEKKEDSKEKKLKGEE